MALTNFTELKSSIADFLNRDDLTSVIPTFIALAEAHELQLQVIDGACRESGLNRKDKVPLSDQLLPIECVARDEIERHQVVDG